MMIIDAHHHLGACRVFDVELTEDVIVATMDANDVSMCVMQPFPGAPDPRAVHDAIADMSVRHDKRFKGIASLSPHCDAGDYFKEVERCIRKLGFVAVKLHTIGHAVNPMSADAETIFVTARDLGVPVMVHTGTGIPFADPASVLSRAMQFPEVKVILAHGGHGFLGSPAVAVAKACPNVYIETSWSTAYDVLTAVYVVGADRVMFGSDLPMNVKSELTKIRGLGLSEEILRQVLGGTASRVFGIEAA